MPITHYSSLTGQPIGPLPGQATQAGRGAYGQVPTVPNPIDTQGQAITGNLGNLAGLYNLTTGTSGASAAGAAAQYGANLPLYGPLTQQGSQNILNDLHGVIAPDVLAQMGIGAAQRGVGFGADSPNSNAAYLAALGRTSQQLMSQGQQELTQAIGRTPVGPAFNPGSFLVTPGEQQQAQYAANLFNAAPNPGAAANAGLHQAQAGLGAGLNFGGMPNYGGGGVGRDALGFPITPDSGYGAGGPPEIFGGSMASGTNVSGTTPNNLAAWNQWWNTGSQGAMGGLPTDYAGSGDFADQFYGWDSAADSPAIEPSAIDAGVSSMGEFFG